MTREMMTNKERAVYDGLMEKYGNAEIADMFFEEYLVAVKLKRIYGDAEDEDGNKIWAVEFKRYKNYVWTMMKHHRKFTEPTVDECRRFMSYN